MNTKILIPFALGIIGYVFTIKPWLLFMDKLDPFIGLIVYYIILTFTITIIQFLGMSIGGIDYNYNIVNYTTGLLFIIFSFNLVTSWQSCYINEITKGNCDNVSSIFLHTEDGATYYLLSNIIKNQEIKRIATYVITPFVFSFIGIYLMSI